MLRSVAAATHPRTAGGAAQAGVLLAAVLLGLLLGTALVQADQRSWAGARTVSGTVLGLGDEGIRVRTEDGDVAVHLERVPATGTPLSVEVAPDGRARPSSYRQTWSGGLLEGVLLALGLAVVVQVYRWFVTRRPVPSGS